MSCWGDGFPGQLGNGSTTDQLVPTAVAGANNIAVIAVGGDRTCARGASGAVACWGENSDGQLGDGTTTDRTTPTSCRPCRTASSRSTPVPRHTCAARAAATMCWGDNISGQLGDGTSFDRLTPVAVSGIAGSQVRAGGIAHVWHRHRWRSEVLGPELLRSARRRFAVPAQHPGRRHRHRRGERSRSRRPPHVRRARRRDRRCWGSNVEGQIGKPSYFPVPVQTAVGGAACRNRNAAGAAGGSGYVPLRSGAVVGYAVGELDGGWVVRGWWSAWCGFGVGVGGGWSWWCAGGCCGGGGERDGGGSVGGGVRDGVPVWFGGAGGVESELRGG